MMDWVCKTDAQDDFLRESNRRVQPCGKWLLEHAVFQDWLTSSNNRILRILGCPGSGKTVLSTSIIEYIQQAQHADASNCTTYFYCSKSEQNQDVLSILTGLIKQILAQLDDLPSLVSDYYNRSLKSGRTSLSMNDNPALLLESLCSPFSQLYIVRWLG
jgi:Cdc6-like AAA superfamily ATPase